jgi:hypothetical protein
MLINSALELRRLVASSGTPVEYTQGSYRLRVMPGVGRIPDVSFSIWETENETQWELILTGWVRGEHLIVSTWSAPGSPDNVESMLQFILAGKRHIVDSPFSHRENGDAQHRQLAAAAS